MKVFSTLRTLSWRKDYLSKSAKRTLVLSLAMPHIALSTAAFTNMNVHGQNRMQILVNSCLCFIRSTPRFRPRSRVRSSLRILSFYNLRKHRTLCSVHKLVYGKHSAYLKEILLTLTPRSQRRVAARSFAVPHFRHDAYQKSFIVQGIRAWNKLPPLLRKTASHSAFKRALKRHLLAENATRDRSMYF